MQTVAGQSATKKATSRKEIRKQIWKHVEGKQ